MGFRFESEQNGKWWELMMGWKWPHQGFTIGYDLTNPSEPIEENEITYFAFLLYLGPVSIIYTWGNHDWDE